MNSGVLCGKENCDVAETGKCLLGNDPVESCPEYDPEEVELDTGEDAADTEDGEVENRAVDDGRRLFRSELLTSEELWPLCTAVPTETISLVGDVRAGKTTLIAALYASFCKGPFAGYRFKSSRSLVGFARRHHEALEKSKRELPTTPRTSRVDGVGFFHLNVVGASREHHLLISDRSGEDFEDARKNTSLVSNLWELKMAGRICFLLDAGMATHKEQRAVYRRSFKQQILALWDNNAIPEGAALEIISTKLDRLAPKGTAEPNIGELVEFENAVLDELSKRGIDMKLRRVCALPRSNFAVGLVGLDELFQGWLEARPTADVGSISAIDPRRWIDRMI